MALTTRVGLTITLTVNTTCENITLKDTTGVYDATTNPLGYGMPGGIATSDVNTIIIVVNLSGGVYLTYTFTIVAGNITAATLGISGATPTSILASLSSAVWYTLMSGGFGLFTDYGVTLPTFADGIYEVDYTVKGTSSDTLFNYTTSVTKLVMCDACCCVSKMGVNIDPECNCSEDALWNFLKADAYLQVAKFATQVGNTDRAQLALDKATNLCDCGCSDC